MTRRRLQNAGLGLLVFALLSGWPQAWQRPQSSLERAQEQPFPAGSPFALLPGFTIERVTPAEKTESLIVVTFDSLGRPVVSQSSSGNGSSPRVLLDANGDGVFEGETIISDKLNTCHGLFYAGRTLYANCRGVVAGDPPPDAAPAGPPQGGGGRGNQGPTIGIPGFYKLEDTNGDDVMDTIERIQRYTSNGMGDHGRRHPPRTRRLDHVPRRQQHLRRRGAGHRRCGRQGCVAELEQLQGTSVPAGLQRSALRQQHTRRRALDRVATAAEQHVRPLLQRDAESLRLRLQPRRRGVRLRQRHGMGRQRPVVPRSTHRPHDPGRRRRLSQRHRQDAGRVLRRPARAAPPASRLARRSRGLPELRVSVVFFRQSVRGGLVARPAALHGAHAKRRHVQGPRGSRRVRPRGADADHRSRSRS